MAIGWYISMKVWTIIMHGYRYSEKVLKSDIIIGNIITFYY